MNQEREILHSTSTTYFNFSKMSNKHIPKFSKRESMFQFLIVCEWFGKKSIHHALQSASDWNFSNAGQTLNFSSGTTETLSDVHREQMTENPDVLSYLLLEPSPSLSLSSQARVCDKQDYFDI